MQHLRALKKRGGSQARLRIRLGGIRKMWPWPPRKDGTSTITNSSEIDCSICAPRKGESRVGTEGTFGRGDLSVCPHGGLAVAHEYLISYWRGIPQGSPKGQTLKGTSPSGHFCASLKEGRLASTIADSYLNVETSNRNQLLNIGIECRHRLCKPGD